MRYDSFLIWCVLMIVAALLVLIAEQTMLLTDHVAALHSTVLYDREERSIIVDAFAETVAQEAIEEAEESSGFVGRA